MKPIRMNRDKINNIVDDTDCPGRKDCPDNLFSDLQSVQPHLTSQQVSQFARTGAIYREWNTRINVISRKDIDHFETRHLLHSLSIAKIVTFKPGSRVLDAGTGGGFPGIPLAIMFPDAEFVLVDSVVKKIRVINAVAEELGLKNVITRPVRFETINEQFDFVTGRAVTRLADFYSVVWKNVRKQEINAIRNGVLYLTGGETASMLASIPANSFEWNLSGFFCDPWFQSKKLVHLFTP